MSKRIKVGFQRAFVREFDAEAQRRGLCVRHEGHRDTHSGEYVMDTALGEVRVAVSGSPIMLHVYRRFDDMDRARPVMSADRTFNPYSGKWNTWESAVENGEQVTALVSRVFDELDELKEGR